MQVALVGGGMASEAFLFSLVDQGLQDIEVTQFEHPVLAPRASQIPLALTSLHNNTHPTTALGNLLSKSFQHFKKEIFPLFQSVTPVRHSIVRKGTKKITEAFLTDRQLFSKEIGTLTKVAVGRKKESLIKSVAQLEGSFDRVVLAPGAFYYHIFRNEITNPQLRGSKIVPGHYMTSSTDYGETSFVTSVDGHNLIYSGERKLLLLVAFSGGEAVANPASATDMAALYETWSLFEGYLGEMPPFESFSFHTLCRLKGWRRMPFFGRVSEKTYALSGLYKNGQSLSFFMAKELLVDMVQNFP